MGMETIKDAQERVSTARADLKAAVVQVLLDGYPVREITAETGLASATIAKIKREAGLKSTRTYYQSDAPATDDQEPQAAG